MSPWSLVCPRTTSGLLTFFPPIFFSLFLLFSYCCLLLVLSLFKKSVELLFGSLFRISTYWYSLFHGTSFSTCSVDMVSFSSSDIFIIAILGTPGWFSQLCVLLLLLSGFILSGLWDQAYHQVPCNAWRLLEILCLPLSLTCALSLCLYLKIIIIKAVIKLFSNSNVWVPSGLFLLIFLPQLPTNG